MNSVGFWQILHFYYVECWGGKSMICEKEGKSCLILSENVWSRLQLIFLSSTIIQNWQKSDVWHVKYVSGSHVHCFISHNYVSSQSRRYEKSYFFMFLIFSISGSVMTIIMANDTINQTSLLMSPDPRSHWSKKFRLFDEHVSERVEISFYCR